MAINVHSSFAVHAGDWLMTEIVKPHNIKIGALADKFGVTRQALSALLNGHASLTADMAIRFEHAFGVKAETLMRMQTRHDLAQAREHESELAVESLVAA